MAGSKGSKYYNIFLDYTIRLDHKEQGNIINDFKFNLLEKIKETGSLKLASEKLGVSYRKAWGNVEEVESGLGFRLVERQRGGAMGGKTSLTADGEKLLEAYNELKMEFNESIYKVTKKFFQSINS